jgi:hypothetical protein
MKPAKETHERMIAYPVVASSDACHPPGTHCPSHATARVDAIWLLRDDIRPSGVVIDGTVVAIDDVAYTAQSA